MSARHLVRLLSFMIREPRFTAAVMVVPTILGYLFFRRFKSRHPGMVQIRLNEHSCVQYDHLAGPSIISEFFCSHAWLAPLVAIVVLATNAFTGSLSPGQFCLWLAALTAVEACLWPVCRSFRRRLKQIPDGAIADINMAYRQPTAWVKIQDFSLVVVEPGSYRLTIRPANALDQLVARLRRFQVVDAEVCCSAEQAKELRALLSRWIRSSWQAA